MNDAGDFSDLADSLISFAKQNGAEEVEIFGQIGNEFEVTVRDSKIEALTRNQTRGIGLRIFSEGRMAFSHSSDWNLETLKHLIAHTIDAAKYSGKDEFNGLPTNTDLLEKNLELFDSKISKIDDSELIKNAFQLEEISKNYDPKIKQTEGATIGSYVGSTMIANSNGILRKSETSVLSASVQAVATTGSENQVAGWYDTTRKLSELESIESIGKTASQRAIDRLSAQKIKTGKYKVIFDPVTASNFFSSLFPAFSGEMINKGASFLHDDLSRPIAPEFLTLSDDPHILSGIGSKIFDGEGNPTKETPIIKNGILTNFLYDTYQAKKTGKSSTGNASRSYKSIPSVGFHCLKVSAGTKSLEEMLIQMDEGILITGTIGFGVDTVAGNYSKGAHGWFIKNGSLSFPIHEFTIADSIKNMLQNIVEVGNDSRKHGTVLSPSVYISEMTIAGL